MTKKFLFMLLGAVAIVSCNKFDLNYDEARQAEEAKEAQEVKENAAKIFGEIDPKQDWNSISNGTVSVTANANLSNIVKVQILTEAPFLNNDAKVLSEANVKNGDQVTLTYSAPNVYKQLVAACVDNKGVYYIQVFDVGQTSVSFAQAKQSNSARRALASDAPDFTSIKLKAHQKSINTRRTESTDAKFSMWKDSKWNDNMWVIADGQTFSNGWKMDSPKAGEKADVANNRGVIYRDIDGFADGELANVEYIMNSLFVKYADKDKQIRKNNAESVRNSAYYASNNHNYFETDGVNPVTLIPIQAYTDDFKQNHLFYYYYKPEDVIASGMDEVEYIKQLPKYMAIQVERIQTTVEKNAGTFYRRQEFLLPFYKNDPVQGDNEATAIFPKGYKVGFLNLKTVNVGTYNITDEKYGCTYGDGRLNYEINQYGSFKSAMDTSLGGKYEGGMTWTDPRIAIFTANGKTYMCIEEGADCNFSDMVIEIGGGLNIIDETPKPEAEIYTMCFEDRLATADYDLNDVVLRCTRVDNTTLKLALVATGAKDNVVIHGANGWAYNGKEVHEIFGVTETFINTEKGEPTKDVVSANVTVAEDVTIPDFLKNIFIENKTTGKFVRMAQAGEPPYAIIVPGDFDYPVERVSIINAYKKFINWAQDMTVDKDWYTYPEEGLVYPSLFK